MEERLVDVLDGHNRILHVFPVPAYGGRSEEECVQQAVQEATHLKLVPDEDVPRLHGRPHVCRGGSLTPVADVLQLRADEEDRRRDAIRTRAYFMWIDAGRPSGMAEQHWTQAMEVAETSAAA